MTIVVTGAGGGLGKAIATQLTELGKPVLGLTRRDADLSRMGEVRGLGQDILARCPDVQVLINNAGVSKFTRELTPDGFEMTFATNYLAPFLLSNLLLPALTRNRGTIVNVGSEQHRWVRAVPWDDLQGERSFNPIERYSLSKLYLALFTRELARRAAGIVVSCVSPGFLRTRLGREATGAFRVFIARDPTNPPPGECRRRGGRPGIAQPRQRRVLPWQPRGGTEQVGPRRRGRGQALEPKRGPCRACAGRVEPRPASRPA